MMPGTYINMLLARASYDAVKDLPSGFEVLTEWPLQDGYSGTAFINRLTRQVIIAHKGSDSPLSDPGDWIKNNLSHALGTKMPEFQEYIAKGIVYTPGRVLKNLTTGKTTELPDWSDQLRESEAFVRSVVRSPVTDGYEISQTGHSLGGFLASVNGAKFGTPVEAFDPPASRHYLDYLAGKGKLTPEQIGFAEENTRSHLSEGSFMSLMYGPDDYHGAVNRFDLGDFGPGPDWIEKHSMDRIIEGFDPGSDRFHNTAGSASPAHAEEGLSTLFDRITAQIERVRANIGG